MDRRLEPFVDTIGAEDADRSLGDLLSREAAPIIRSVVARRLGPANPDGEDLVARVMVHLVGWLRRGKTDHTLAQIDAFPSYVASAAHHECDHYVRHKHPARWRLRNRIRYAIEHDARLALWKSADGRWIAGRAAWRGDPPMAPQRLVGRLLTVRARDERALVDEVITATGGPVELLAIVELAASLWSVPSQEASDVSALDTLADRQPPIDAVLSIRREAQEAWGEIRNLPVRQRQALLLHLKDDALSLFPLTGTATLDELAVALELTVESLAALWNDLPLNDNELAARLGCSRQQVINLRMAARKRLGNRLVHLGQYRRR
jgi:DNA-directed RNA polymerase specialized sigma24 family protein